MTRKSGKHYEDKFIKLLRDRGVFAVGLQPKYSPDVIIPQINVAVEIKSTKKDRFYPSTDREQYEYLKNQFINDWGQWRVYYGVYFIKIHQWKMFRIDDKIPYNCENGLDIELFLDVYGL